MQWSCEGRKALVTGASRGIGKAIALAYTAAGMEVAVTARDRSSLDETVRAIEEQGGRARALAWDMSAIADIEPRLIEVRDLLGGLDVLVNNAGVFRHNDDAATPEENWDFVMTINLKAVYFMCQAAGRLMQEQKSGVIVNIASDAGMRAAAHVYGISKWGVIGLTKGFAQKLGPEIRVNAIAPGPVATAMMGWAPGQSMDAPQLPLGRYALPEEIADMALYLASDLSRATFGQILVANTSNT